MDSCWEPAGQAVGEKERRERVKEGLPEREKGKKWEEQEMTVNSLLCHLLSWMNKAKRSGIMQNNCRPRHTGLWAMLRTSTVFLWLLRSLASQTVSFFPSLHYLPSLQTKPGLASGLSRLLPPAQRIYRLPLLLGSLKYPEIIHI